MKLVYLAQKEVPSTVEALTGSATPYQFSRYLYGPFSSDLLHDVDLLASRGFIEQRSRPLDRDGKAIRWEYGTTESGRARVANIQGGARYQELQNLVTRFGSMPTQALLRYVYTKYVRDSEPQLEWAQPAQPE
jgi:uncharacterized protein YwgA